MCRKKATRFEKDEVKSVKASDLNADKAFESFSDMPVFIEPYSEAMVEEPSIKVMRPAPRKTKVGASKTKRLPSLFEEFEYKREVKIFLSLCVLVFFVGLSIGLLNPGVFTNMKLTTRAVYSFFSPSYTASYLMIRPSVLDKKVIRFRSDAKKGAYVGVSVIDPSGNVMSIKGSSGRSFDLPLDAAGVAEINLSKFNLSPFKNYVVVAKMGGLEAKKSVIYVP